MSAVGGVNSPGPSPIFTREKTKWYTRPLLSQNSKLGFTNDSGSRANSSFSGVRVCTCVHCTEYTRDAHTQETVYSRGWEDKGVVVKLEE